MSALFPPPQTRTIGRVDQRGQVTIDIAWFLFLTQGLYERAGGALGASTSDLETAAFEDAGIEEAKAGIYRLADDIGQRPLLVEHIQAIDTQISDLREAVAALARTLQDIQEGQTL